MNSNAPKSPSTSPSVGPSMGPPTYKRSIKNFIVDARFQLKYTAILVAVALAVSAVLVAVLMHTSSEVIGQGEQAALQGRRAIDESKKLSDVVRMSMKDDPVYGQNPDLLAAFNSQSIETDKKLDEQQRALDDQQQAIVRQQRSMVFSLVGGLALMVLLVGMIGIYVTHKVAGPIYKMKMLLKQVGAGKLHFEGRLRKGDELQDFFDVFARMVENLRRRQAVEVQQLEEAMRLARTEGASGESLAKIGLVHDEMKKALER